MRLAESPKVSQRYSYIDDLAGLGVHQRQVSEDGHREAPTLELRAVLRTEIIDILIILHLKLIEMKGLLAPSDGEVRLDAFERPITEVREGLLRVQVRHVFGLEGTPRDPAAARR